MLYVIYVIRKCSFLALWFSLQPILWTNFALWIKSPTLPFSAKKTFIFWSTVIVNTNRPRRVGEKSIHVLLKSLPGKAKLGVRVKTKPYQAIFTFLCVPIVVVVVLLVKSFSCSPKVAKELFHIIKKEHGVKNTLHNKANIDNS